MSAAVHNPITRTSSVTGPMSTPPRPTRSLSSPQPLVAITSASKSKSSKKDTSVAYCMPAATTTTTTKKSKRQSLPPIKSVSTSSLHTVAEESKQKEKEPQSQPLKVWLMSLLKISSSHRTAPTKVLTAPAATASISKPKPQSIKVKPIVREVQPRVQSYIKLIDQHREFFKGCPEIDCYLISMAFLYLQRATPVIPIENMNTEMLFFALYLAWESEEDSTVGIEGIIHYIIGPYPSSRGKDKITRKYEIMEWRRKLNVFHTGKDKLWKALDYNTYADLPAISKTMLLFPETDVFTRARKPEELRRYF